MQSLRGGNHRIPLFEALEPRLLLSGNVLISEFMADNGDTPLDGFGNSPDWIELQNTSTSPVDLTGWKLQDSGATWIFPAVTLPAQGYLLVFASDENGQDPAGYWHTNFKLDADGEYLALLNDTGTVVHEYDPNYPRQLDDISYGVLYSEEGLDVLVDKGAAANYLIPTTDPAPAWIDPAFDDSTWNTGTTGLGFGLSVPGGSATLISKGSSWRYLDDGSDQGTAWRGTGFDDGTWAFGPAELGYGDGGEATIVSYGGNSSNKYITTYFRHEFDVTNAWAYTDLTINVQRDDGAVVYLNGQEIARSNMPTGLVGYLTTSQTGVGGGDESTFFEYHKDPSGILVDGENVLAVEIHQTSGTSSDISFDLELIGATSTSDLIETDLSGMLGVSPSALVRIPFDVNDPLEYADLTLEVAYEDGFVAYLNGEEVAVRNAPTSPGWNSTALSDRSVEDAVQFEAIDLTAYLDADPDVLIPGELVAGENVLAIHALNDGISDSMFLICPKLTALAGVTVTENYFTTPTPGAANIAGVLGMVKDTQFSVNRGFYEDPFDVEITTSTGGAEIRYTLDGSEPTAVTGTVYADPIHITGTTILRAIAYKPGYLSTNVDAQTYIFLDDVINQPTNPAGFEDYNLWRTEPSDYEMDPDITGDPLYSDQMIDALQSLPTMSIVMDADDLFGYSTGIYSNPNAQGVGWERSTSLEYFDPNSNEEFQVNAGIRIYGGVGRNPGYKKHSFRVLFKGIYGPTKLEFPLFGESATDRFDSFVLRANFNDAWSWGGDNVQFIRDTINSELQLAMGMPAKRSSFVHLYVNGLYWGLYDPTERPDQAFSSSYMDGEKEDWDGINSGGGTSGSSTAAYYTFANFGDTRDLTTMAAYQEFMGNNPDGTNNPAYETYLDAENYISYLLQNYYTGNRDWPGHNWYAGRLRGPESTGFKWYSWDAEWCIGMNSGVTQNQTGVTSALCKPYGELRYNPEFQMLFADIAHRHLFNDGALTLGETAELYSLWADQIELGVITESARWGDIRTASPRTVEHWRNQRNWILNTYLPARSSVTSGQSSSVLQQLKGAGLYPNVVAPSFNINSSYQHGGIINLGDSLAIDAPAGTIYYTLDGTDPRLLGGDVSPDAIEYTGPVALDASAYVFSRVLNGDTWSALNEATYDVSTTPTVAITEINYHPHDPSALEEGAGFEDAEDFEFVEFRNTGAQAVNLRTVHFSDGIEFDFTRSSVTSLAPDAYALVVRNTAAFQARYPSVPAGIIAGEFTGALNSDGEDLALVHGASSAIHNFAYNDSGSWPGKADGKGATLTVVDTAGDYGDSDNWTPSVAYGGTPGEESQLPLGIVINEVLTHTDIPDVDSIELHNTTGESIDIGGWFLSDTWGSSLNPLNGDYKKFQIPAGTTIPAGGYIVFDEDDFNPIEIGGGSLIQFALDGAHGDNVWLMQADGLGNLTHFADHVEFGGARNGESFGRWPDGTGGLYPMILQTLGDDNSSDVNNGPRAPDPLIISELHYNSSEPDSSDDLEFVEIHNHSDEEVGLTGWRIRGEVDYDFYPGTIIAAGGTLVVLSFNPDNAARVADFRAAHGIDGSVALAGGYGGKLDNGGGRVVLQSPDEPPIEEPEYIPHLVEDEANYDDEAPWPASPDGLGDSLNRSDPHFWGNDSASWHAAAPTPGFYERLNKFPYFTSAPLAVATEGVPFSYEVTADDPDIDDWLTITAATPLPGWLTLVDHGTGDGTATLSGTPPSGSVVVDLLVTDGLDATDDQAFSITVYDASEPAVVQVFVSSSEWSTLFLDDLDSENLLHQPIPQLGYRITDEVAPLDALPWGNLDTLVICFSRDVATELDNLTLSGVSEPLYTTGEADYTLSTFTAAWTLPDPIGTDKLLIDLPGAAVGDFQLRFDALPGDTTRDGATNLVDRDGIRDRMFVWADQGGYSGFYDLNGSGRIDFLDWSVVLANRGASLPPGAPTAPAGAAGQSAALAAGASGEIFMVNASVAPPSGVPAPLTASIPAPLATDAPADPIRFASYAPASEPAIDLTSAADYLPSPTFRQVEAIASGVDDPPSQILLQTGFDESTAPVSLDPDLDAPLVDILAEAEFEAFSLL